MQPLDVSHGIDSEIVGIVDGDGRQVSAAWLRRLRRTGQFLFSGAYAVRSLPGSARPSVHVTFPLEKGNVQVFLRPEVRADGALVLSSSSRAFGGDGAYVVVHGASGAAWAARAPIHEEFVVHVDDRGEPAHRPRACASGGRGHCVSTTGCGVGRLDSRTPRLVS